MVTQLNRGTEHCLGFLEVCDALHHTTALPERRSNSLGLMELAHGSPLCLTFTGLTRALCGSAHAKLHVLRSKCISLSEYMAWCYAACLWYETPADNVGIVKQNGTCSSNQFICFRASIHQKERDIGSATFDWKQTNSSN